MAEQTSKPAKPSQPKSNGKTGQPSSSDKPGQTGETGQPSSTDKPGQTGKTGQPKSNGKTGQTSAPAKVSQSPDAIEAEIAQTRAHLASTIDELAVRAQPREIARRQTESVKARVVDATHTPEGDLRVERVGAIAAAAAAVLVVLAVLHRRHRG